MPAFDPTTTNDAEKKVLTATATGEWARFTPTDTDRTIRATFLRHLLLALPDEHGKPWPLRLPGLRIHGAIIEGRIDLADCTGPEGQALPTIALEDCDIPDSIDLSNTRIARLSIAGSRFSHLKATHARIDGPFSFANTKPSKEIAGIFAHGLAVDGDVDGRACSLFGAPVPASNGEQRRDDAVVLSNATITGDIDIRNATLHGGLSLHDASVSGTLSGDRAKLHNPNGNALVAENAEIGGDALLRNGFEADGRVSLMSARITGTLACDGAKLRNPNGVALVAQNAEIGGGAYLRNGFEADGRVSLLGARITGNLECGDAKLRNLGGIALNAYNTSIGGSLRIHSGASVTGRIFLHSARVTGECEIIDATLANPAAIAIEAPHLQIGASLTLSRLNIMGSLNLSHVRIGASLIAHDLSFPKTITLDGATITYENDPDILIDLSHASIAAALQPRGLTAEISGHIDLQSLRAGSLDDDYENFSGWGDPATWTLKLDGMVYDRLNLNNVTTGPNIATTRLAWLKREGNFRPQPYRHLAKVLRQQGLAEEAREIGIAEGDAMPIRGNPAFRYIWKFWGIGFGYGLSPARAAATLLVCAHIGWLGACNANLGAKVMVLSATNVTGWSSQRSDGPQPVFRSLAPGVGEVELPCGNQINELLYTLDTMLPVVPLHQEGKCEISTEPRLHEGQWLEGWRFFKGLFSIVGKLITTLAIITFSGILRPRDQE